MYYAPSVNPTMLIALGSITAQQANPMDHTMQKLKQLLDYAATYTDAITTYHISNMVLAGYSDDSYIYGKKSIS